MNWNVKGWPVADRIRSGAALASVGLLCASPWPRMGLGLLLLTGLSAAGEHAGGELRSWGRAAHRQGVRSRQRWREALERIPPLHRPAPLIAIAWYGVAFAIFGSLAALVLWMDDEHWALFTDAVGLTCVVAALDFGIIAWRCARWAWGHPVGKAVVSALSTLVAANAFSWAREAVWAITQEDPGKAPVSVALFTALFGSLAWINAMAMVCTFASLPLMGRILVDPPTTGRPNRPRSVVRTLIRGLRPVCVCLAPLMVLMVATTGALPHNRWVRAAGLLTIVHLDYFEKSACGQPIERANRIDDHRVSVAWMDHHWPAIKTVGCPRP